MKQKLPFVLEIIWLLVAIISILFAIVRTYNLGFKENIMLYVIAMLASLMYGSRRYLRKTREGINQDRD
ncbi:hypothetical protein EO244_13995 [Ancylomarina salipaludis]|uniref:Uncharacterized protein n=1 Tax=Ancylomarina salipaludis TaxID=2501299 RepID=A0A4Q1JJ11_9BACT|nr:hypothetical protein [Ancylomarina salipaludis]RXQ89891.1 hypothetical protein EO244_13995 [Ancylomarina salipaludis]